MQVTLYLENAQFQPKGSRGTARGENPDAVWSERGELQLAGFGISGIPVFQISRYATRAPRRKHPYVLIDFAPDLTDKEFLTCCQEKLYENGYGKSAGEAIDRSFNQKAERVLLSEAGAPWSKPMPGRWHAPRCTGW